MSHKGSDSRISEKWNQNKGGRMDNVAQSYNAQNDVESDSIDDCSSSDSSVMLTLKKFEKVSKMFPGNLHITDGWRKWMLHYQTWFPL